MVDQRTGLLPIPDWDPPFTLPEGVTVRGAVAFARYGDRELLADLFLPEPADAPTPAMVFAFGGGWRVGARTHFYRQAALLAAEGIAGMCIDYRLSAEATYPAAVHDCKAAVRYLRAHAADLNIDPGRIGAAGGSSGGHLAALLATTAGDAALEGDGGHARQQSDVQLAVLFNPATDLRDLRDVSEQVRESVESFIGSDQHRAPDLYEEASPIARLSPRTAPVLVLHGTEDQAVSFATAERFVAAAKARGVDARLVPAAGQEHGYFNRSPHFQSTLTEMSAFIRTRFASR